MTSGEGQKTTVTRPGVTQQELDDGCINGRVNYTAQALMAIGQARRSKTLEAKAIWLQEAQVWATLAEARATRYLAP